MPEAGRLLGATPVLPVTDLRRSFPFWEAVLGFQRVFAFGDPPEYAGFVRDDVEVHLVRCDDPAAARWGACRIQCDRIEELYAECERLGLIPKGGQLAERRWSSREFFVIDPGGAAITFWEPLVSARM